MTAYATLASLTARFGTEEITEISDLTGAGTIDEARVAQSLGDTGTIIDSYLVSRYTLPLAQIPERLESLACDIARYLLATLPTEEMRRRYDDARQWLGLVADGTYGLGLDTALSDTAPDAPAIAVTANRRVFSEHHLRDYLFPRDSLP
ncbi:MAG TPA: phage protein Gp36 family protein [Stellaceae bacterium]|nr:phage protein Gp36 family protein [Stellaceae bacterium]